MSNPVTKDQSPVDISPEAVEQFCNDLDSVAGNLEAVDRPGSARAVFDAEAIIRALRSTLSESLAALDAVIAERDAAYTEVDAVKQSLAAAQHESDGLNTACGQWREQFDAKDAALQQARAALTASEKRVADLERRMTDARRILTNGNPTPDCNWGILDVTKDLGHVY